MFRLEVGAENDDEAFDYFAYDCGGYPAHDLIRHFEGCKIPLMIKQYHEMLEDENVDGESIDKAYREIRRKADQCHDDWKKLLGSKPESAPRRPSLKKSKSPYF